MSFQSAGGFFSVPVLAMKFTNAPMPPSFGVVDDRRVGQHLDDVVDRRLLAGTFR